MATRPSPNDLNSVGIATAARVLNVARGTLYNWAAAGTIKLYPMRGKLGRTGKPALRVMRTDLDRLLKQRRTKK